MTAVICWSMKMRMVQSRAGRKVTMVVHQGFGPTGFMSQPRSSLVGWGTKESVSFWSFNVSLAYLGGKVAARLELLEEGGHEDGGEEEDDAPEEDVGDVGAVGAAGAALELPVKHLALLLAPEDTVMMTTMKTVLTWEAEMFFCSQKRRVSLLGFTGSTHSHLRRGLVDEDDADERRESFLCEARDVTDERAGVRGHQQETEEGRPQADARPQGEESSEGDDRRHAGAVEEEERGQTLQADGIREVGDVIYSVGTANGRQGDEDEDEDEDEPTRHSPPGALQLGAAVPSVVLRLSKIRHPVGKGGDLPLFLCDRDHHQ
ncbi:hypothetical protein EYF80_038807 [Liparis tanakae]|uniref:Uncharacterized protein n=1 Tax=Liparis tanakae TaxID=230148 RepID=A0A4Z2GCZ7_9TELE|nr:hypothetical protein EYF80_038807 [Liparis tanakae]